MGQTGRVLITGASGFIGGRLVEILVNRGIPVRVTTSDLRHCEHIAHLPIEIVKADLSDQEALSDAVAGCSVVFHIAYRFGGNIEQQKVNFVGTRVLAEAFCRNGGRRFVHVSSMCAYGDPRDEDLTEDTPLRPSADAYSETKRQIDLLLLEMHRARGFPVTIIQPTIVYGPRGTFWTMEPLQQVRSMRIALPASGLGLCNAVYVDDVVSALILAAERDAAVGETFLISDAAPVTWREFYGAFEKMMGKKAVVDLDENQLRIEQDRRRKSQSLTHRLPRALARRLLPATAKAFLKRYRGSLEARPTGAADTGRPLLLPDGPLHALYASKTHIRIEKARKILGYNPVFDLDLGMARTAEWARSSNLLSG
jgi:nucleoside-diphosphate-sugar epimerase